MNGSRLTIVMYHYVRDLARSRYPEIKGLTSSDFRGQIGYIKRHYNVISGPELMDAVGHGAPLPPRPLLLTFDDGYIDHFTEVLPILKRERLPACFFPPAKCILENKVLDVNKIHFILAATPDKDRLAEVICERIRENTHREDVLAPEEYWEKWGKPSRWDPAEVVFCKRMLQRELPLDLRQAITDELFRILVTADEDAFARELYMSVNEIRELRQSGMEIGSHGYAHFWLNRLAPEEQAAEIDRSLEFLSLTGADPTRWIMCYPYGAYDESLLSILRTRNCVAGLTTEVGLASIKNGNALTLPRIDTNDLPKLSGAEPNEWTAKAS